MAGSTGVVESRAIVFAQHGDPTQVLKGHQYQLKPLKKGEVRVKFDLSAINPADMSVPGAPDPLEWGVPFSADSVSALPRCISNVIQGNYPQKPQPRDDIGPGQLSIMGNEGTGTVEGFEEDGQVEHKFKIGDRGEFLSILLAAQSSS
jgi:trans-2-enoyl-CoA reductase